MEWVFPGRCVKEPSSCQIPLNLFIGKSVSLHLVRGEQLSLTEHFAEASNEANAHHVMFVLLGSFPLPFSLANRPMARARFGMTHVESPDLIREEKNYIPRLLWDWANVYWQELEVCD